MTVSVVMATYNGAEFIVEQLDTIREQSRPVDELIICDDGSTDKTVEIAQAYISEHGLKEKWRIFVAIIYSYLYEFKQMYRIK